MATVHANQILTIFMLLLGGHYHCVKVSSDSETVRGMGLWEFSGALRELMLKCHIVGNLVSRLKCGLMNVCGQLFTSFLYEVSLKGCCHWSPFARHWHYI